MGRGNERARVFNSELELGATVDEEASTRTETAYTPHELTAEQKAISQNLVSTLPSCVDMGLGKTDLEDHVIEVTQENLPIKQRHYPISPAKQQLVFAELDRMIGLGVIEESNSSWSSPVTLAQKGTKNRLCLDARKVNSRTIKDAFPLPHIEGLLSRLQETYYISAIDLKDAFWQIPLEAADPYINLQSCHSAFATPRKECAD